MIADRKRSVKQKSDKNNLVGNLDIIKTAGEISLQKGLDFEVIMKALESAIEAVAYQKYVCSIKYQYEKLTYREE